MNGEKIIVIVSLTDICGHAYKKLSHFSNEMAFLISNSVGFCGIEGRLLQNRVKPTVNI